MVPTAADVVEVIRVVAFVGMVLCSVVKVSAIVEFGFVVVLTKVVVIVCADTDAVVASVVAFGEIVEGFVILVVTAIAKDVLMPCVVVVVAVTVVFSSGALALDSSAAAVVFSVCTFTV